MPTKGYFQRSANRSLQGLHYSHYMTNLIPEPRTDRNGKVTIRWVRNATQQAPKALQSAPPVIKPIPAPVTEGDVPILAEVIKAHPITSYGATVSDLDPRAALLIEEILKKAQKYGQQTVSDIQFELSSALDDASARMYPSMRPETFTKLNNFAALHTFPGERSLKYHADYYVAGLRQHPPVSTRSRLPCAAAQ